MTTFVYRTVTGKTWHKRRSIGMVAQCNPRYELDARTRTDAEQATFSGTYICMLCFKR